MDSDISLAEVDQVRVPLHICVVGAGYVGLTAAACMAELGHSVRCLESDPAKLASLKMGEIPIYEPGLGELVTSNIERGRLVFTSNANRAISGATLVLLCVGTPPRENGDPDLSQLAKAGTTLVEASDHDLVMVVKSTVPPGSCEALELVFKDVASDRIGVTVCSNPEFLREGHAVYDFFHPDRVVLGIDDPLVMPLMDQIYPEHWPIIKADRRSAELVKYASNAFLAVKISFANEVADLCSRIGANSETVLLGLGADKRIGPQFLMPGPGYGGSCLPKDISGFIAVGEAVSMEMKVAGAAKDVNELRPIEMAERIEIALGGLAGRKVALLGLAFKAGTDDTRYSPALYLAKALADAGAEVVAYDPMARLFEEVPLQRVDDPYSCVQGADALAIAAGWEEFTFLDYEAIADRMSGHVVFDLVGGVDPIALAGCGLDLYGLGRCMSTEYQPLLWTPLLWTR